MALRDYLTSREHGQPVEAFEFIYGEGDGDVFRYTDAERDVVIDGETFSRLAITRSTSIQTKGRPKDTSITVVVPADSEIAALFRGVAPRRVIFLRVYEGVVPNADDPGAWTADLLFGLRWTGRVLESKRNDNGTVTLSCDTSGAGMKRPGLSFFYQRSCQKTLYGPYCRADKTAATTSVVLDGVSADTLFLPSGWEGTNDRSSYVGGIVEWVGAYGTESRMIVDPGETSMFLDSIADGLEAGDSVDLILGCPRTLAACTDLHDNAPNYGGFPWIPLSNPVNKNNHT